MFLFEGAQILNDITTKECLKNAIINQLYHKTTEVLNSRDLELKELTTFADFEKRVLLLIAIMAVESRCKRGVVNNNTNATGIMQLTPICIKEIKKKEKFSVVATDVKSSIEGGIIYINLCYKYFKNKAGLQKNWNSWTDMQKLNAIMYAYNAGPYGIINKISAPGYDPSVVGYSEDIITMMDFFQIDENLKNLKKTIKKDVATKIQKKIEDKKEETKNVKKESKIYLYDQSLVTETFLRNTIIKNLLK
jgi:hypothetical protein